MGGVAGTGGPSGTGYMARASRPQGPAHVYQPTYTNYPSPINQAVYGVARGLGATPQYTQFQAQMPTFSRPQMAPPPPSGGFGRSPMQALSPQPAYRIPYGPSIPQRSINVPRMFGIKPLTPEQEAQNLIRDYRGSNLTEAQYNKMMQNPAMYSDFLRRVDAGENPTTIGYAAPPRIQYMTAAQQQAYNQNLASGLESMIAPRTTFDVSDSSSDGA